jgi:hypothetical protein
LPLHPGFKERARDPGALDVIGPVGELGDVDHHRRSHQVSHRDLVPRLGTRRTDPGQAAVSRGHDVRGGVEVRSHLGAPARREGLSRRLRYVEELTGLDQLPTRGAFFVFLAPKVAGATGGPGRAIALLSP